MTQDYSRKVGDIIEQYSCKKVYKKIVCSNCNHNIVINEVTKSVKCSLCNSTTELSDDFWKRLIKNSANETLKCNDCKKEYELDNIINAIETDSVLICKKCNKPLAIRKLPENYFEKDNLKIIGIFNEQKPNIEKPKDKKIISLECSNCGAPLETNGEERTVLCKYCGTNNLLSPELFIGYKQESYNPFYLFLFVDKWNFKELEIENERKRKSKEDAIRNAVRKTKQKEKKIKNKKKIKKITSVIFGFIILTGVIFIDIWGMTDLISYKEYIEIDNTNYSYVQSNKNDKWGVLNNNTNELVISTKYDRIDFIIDDMFWVRKSSISNIVDTNEKIIPESSYNITNILDEEYGLLSINTDNNNWGLFLENNKKILSTDYKHIKTFDKYAEFLKDEETCLINIKGEIVFSETNVEIISILDNKLKYKDIKTNKINKIEF